MKSSDFLPAAALAAALFAALPALGQQPGVDVARADIRGTYDFDPGKLSLDDQSKRAFTLSVLWDRYDKDPESYREALRGLLGAKGQREILYCDGGMLLIHKSREQEDLDLGLQSIAKCALSDIEHTPYFYTMHALALRGVDTLPLQLRMLSKPKYTTMIVANSTTLGQDYAFLYPLLVQDETKYVPRLAQRATKERDRTAQTTLLLAIWYAATPEAEAALRSIAAKGATKTLRDGATKLLEQTAAFRGWGEQDPTLVKMKEAIKLQGTAGAAELRALRQKRMRTISEDALRDLDIYTVLLYRTIKHGNP